MSVSAIARLLRLFLGYSTRVGEMGLEWGGLRRSGLSHPIFWLILKSRGLLPSGCAGLIEPTFHW